MPIYIQLSSRFDMKQICTQICSKKCPRYCSKYFWNLNLPVHTNNYAGLFHDDAACRLSPQHQKLFQTDTRLFSKSEPPDISLWNKEDSRSWNLLVPGTPGGWTVTIAVTLQPPLCGGFSWSSLFSRPKWKNTNGWSCTSLGSVTSSGGASVNKTRAYPWKPWKQTYSGYWTTPYGHFSWHLLSHSNQNRKDRQPAQ